MEAGLVPAIVLVPLAIPAPPVLPVRRLQGRVAARRDWADCPVAGRRLVGLLVSGPVAVPDPARTAPVGPVGPVAPVAPVSP